MQAGRNALKKGTTVHRTARRVFAMVSERVLWYT